VSVSNETVKGRFEIYRYEEESLPQGDQLITAGETAKVKDKRLKLKLRPHSVVLCHQQ
jgi:alpha-galactosidase